MQRLARKHHFCVTAPLVPLLYFYIECTPPPLLDRALSFVPPLKFYIECTTLLRALSFQLFAAFVISVFGGIILQILEQNISSFTTAQILECLGTETQSELNLKRNAGLLCAANPK